MFRWNAGLAVLLAVATWPARLRYATSVLDMDGGAGGGRYSQAWLRRQHVWSGRFSERRLFRWLVLTRAWATSHSADLVDHERRADA